MFPNAVALFDLDFKALKARLLSEQPGPEKNEKNSDDE